MNTASLTALLAARVRRDGDGLALCSATRRHSYAELDRLTDALAGSIIARRGASAEPVALLVGQDALCIGMLAILKAGKFYVPLDAAEPAWRSKAVLDDVDAALLLVDASTVERGRTLTGSRIDTLDLDDACAVAPCPLDARERAHSDIACVLYTSGTTGTPKGVVHDDRGIAHMALGNVKSLGITPRDRVALISAPAFVGATATVFRTLLGGATLYPFDLRTGSARDLCRWLERERITLAQLVPTVFRQLCSSLDGRTAPTTLRLVHLAGEVVDDRDVELFETRFPDAAALVNEAGTTETGAFARLLVRHGERFSAGAVPIGFPTEDKDILLVGPDGDVVDARAVGEIAVRSAFLARGYWRDPEATAREFLAVPNRTDVRVYLTGDLGRRDDDGRLHVLGRKDHQIKLRGRRVDLSELEIALRRASGGRCVVVDARRSASGAQSLVAYVETGDDPPPEPRRVREALSSVLPHYLHPSAYVFVPTLPLTGSGKVDRCSLPDPARYGSIADTPCRAARTEIERALARSWSALLGVARVGIDDDFLDLGGDSLFAGRVISGIRERWGVALSFGEILEHRTIAELAAEIEARHS